MELESGMGFDKTFKTYWVEYEKPGKKKMTNLKIYTGYNISKPFAKMLQSKALFRCI